MSKISNDEKVKRYKRRKLFRLTLILFAFATVVTAILCLLKIVKIWLPLVLYVITLVFRTLWERNDFHEEKKEDK